MAVRVLVIDDHPVVVHGVTKLLDASEISVVATATRPDDAVKLAKKHDPDVVLLDVRMPEKDGFAVLGKLKAACPDARVVMFSGYDSPTYIARAVAAGAHDYVLKDAPSKQLIAAIKGAAEGLPPSAFNDMRRIASSMANRAPAPTADAHLTPRESQVLRQIALGLSNKEIAQALVISVETVKEHVQNLLRKLAVNDRTQAAVWAVRNGIS